MTYNNLKQKIPMAWERLSELFLLLVSILKIRSDKFKSLLDKPEFSGPNRIAVFLFKLIFLLMNLKSLVDFFSKYLVLFVVAITNVKLESALSKLL